MSPLRIMIVLPMYGGSLPIGRYCASAFRDLGHQIRVFEAPLFYSAFSGIKNLGLSPSGSASVENSFLNVVSQAIWAQAKEFEPHLVLAMAQAPLGKTLLGRLKKADIRTAMWFVEDFRIFTYWKIYAPLYDVFAVIQKEPFLSELKAIGQERALYLPLAALPAFHKKVDLTNDEKSKYGSKISFMGAGYPNRRLVFRPLAGKDFKIWGSDWDGEGILKKNIQQNGKRVTEEDSLKIYSASDINLNLHSSISNTVTVSNGDFVNPRTFELASIGAFQLVDNRKLLDELFAPGELATFNTVDELYDAIIYYLDRPAEREQIAQKARERVHRDHTYQKRMQKLLEVINDHVKQWPDPEKNETDEPEFGQDTKLELEELKKELGLGPNASFDSVLAGLRKKSGKLTGLETGLLFLDEWRKQYGR